MKIKNKEKGINLYPFDEWSEDDIEYYSETHHCPETDTVLERIEKIECLQIEWDKQGEINFNILRQKQKPTTNKYKIAKEKYCIEKEKVAKQKGVKVSELKNYPPLVFEPETNFIGERIEFLMDKNNQEITEFGLNIGMSRSSVHRYIKGTHLPSPQALKTIIDGLYVSIADFCYEPHNFEKWKSAFEQTTDNNDIFKLKEIILEQLRINKFTYKNKGLIMRFPNRYFELFRNLIKNSFDILELIPHDKE